MDVPGVELFHGISAPCKIVVAVLSGVCFLLKYKITILLNFPVSLLNPRWFLPMLWFLTMAEVLSAAQLPILHNYQFGAITNVALWSSSSSSSCRVASTYIPDPLAPLRSSPLAGLQCYILYPPIAALCMFELVVLLLLGDKRGSIEVHHL